MILPFQGDYLGCSIIPGVLPRSIGLWGFQPANWKRKGEVWK